MVLVGGDGGQFDGHAAAQVQVFGDLDSTHAALAEPFQNTIVGDGSPDHTSMVPLPPRLFAEVIKTTWAVIKATLAGNHIAGSFDAQILRQSPNHYNKIP